MSLWLALETSADLAGIAVRGPDGVVQEARIAGARRHASATIPAAIELLAPFGGVAALTGVLIADGPGSFTGLRVAAAVAKALHASRAVPVWAGSALAARAVRHAPREGGQVLVAVNALRNEAYAAVFRVEATGLEVMFEARTVPVGALAAMARGCAVVVLDLPSPDGLGVPEEGHPVRIVAPDAAPSAAGLLTLLGVAGGATEITDVAAWSPVYGRPVEAQIRWEETHGRPLPHPLRTGS
jgi:tRNA threonylcarbamoyladenosine biosynthesis protein TsaB